MTSDHEQYPRVSDILGQWPRFEGIDPLILANKCSIGTAIHAAINAHHEDICFPLRDSEKGYFDSYLQWEEERKPLFIHSEMSLACDDLKYRGTVDAIVQIGSSHPVLIDYKTSVKEDPKFWPAQGILYHHLAKYNGIKISPVFLFIKLDKKGGMPKIYEYTETKEVWDFCLSAINTYHYIRKK